MAELATAATPGLGTTPASEAAAPAKPAGRTRADATLGRPRLAAAPPLSRARGRPRRTSPPATVAMLLGLGIAIYAQQRIANHAAANTALLLYAAAVASFALGLYQASHTGLLVWPGPLASAPEAEGTVPPGGRIDVPGAPGDGADAAGAAVEPARRVRRARQTGINRPVALAALGLGAITFLSCGGNRFTLLNVTTWVASVGLALISCWQPPVPPSRWRDPAAWQAWLGWVPTWQRGTRVRPAAPQPGEAAAGGEWSDGLVLRVPWSGVALALVFAFGAVLLFYRIADVPRDMTSDHAEKLLDVREVLDGQHRIFFPRNTGREAVQFYLIALMTPLTGISYLTMKLGTALVAFLTLPFTFLLARELFGTRLALWTTALLATTRWLLQVARVGLRFPFPPAFASAIFYLLIRALRTRRRNDFLLCGLVLGVAQHTYTALRLAPLAVVACVTLALAVDVWRREPLERVRRLLADTGLLFAIYILAFMPLLRYAFDQPSQFLIRSVTRVASDARTGAPPNVAAVFLNNWKNALLMFNWTSDSVWVNTIPGQPFLDPVSGALFVLGVAYAVYRLLRYRELPYLYLIVLLLVGLLPSVLSLAYPQENPSTVRTGMAIPIAAIFIAPAPYLVARRVRGLIGGALGTAAAGGLLGALFLAILVTNFDQYFHIYARQHARASMHTSAVAEVVNGFLAMGGARDDVHILPGANWVDTRLVAIQAGDIRWDPLINSAEDARKQDGVPRERMYVVKPDDRATLDAFARWYPNAIVKTFVLEEAGNTPWFVTVRIPPGTSAAL